MSGRPFLGHADQPTPHTFARPSFVPPLRIGGNAGGPAFSRGNSSIAPPRAAMSVAAPVRPAAAFGGGGGAAGGGARMAFKPSGGGDGSNVYIYRAPTSLGYRPPTAPSSSPPPGPPAAGGITRGLPSSDAPKMIGGAQRDYRFPAKADYTPYGPRNAPYATVAAGARPTTNAFRTPHLSSHLRSTTRRSTASTSRPRRPAQRSTMPGVTHTPAPKRKGDSDTGASCVVHETHSDEEQHADAEADEGDEEEEEEEDERPRVGASATRQGTARPARPSSAFRGASPREMPPEAFQPDIASLERVMKVTSTRGPKRRGAAASSSSRAGSKASSVAPSMAPSVAGSARSSKSHLRAASEYDPDDPFGPDSPRSHHSHVSAARSTVSAARSTTSTARSSATNRSWYSRGTFHVTGDPATDLALLSAKATELTRQVEEQKRLAAAAGHLADDGEEHKEPQSYGGEENEGEDEVFAADNGGGDHDQGEHFDDDEAQQRADEEAAEADEQQQAEYEQEQEQEEQPADHDDEPDMESSAAAATEQPPASRKVLRPSSKHNAWSSKEPVTQPPLLYTRSQWGEQTLADAQNSLGSTGRLGRTGTGTLAFIASATTSATAPRTNGNDTSDIDTETESEVDASEDERYAVLERLKQRKAATAATAAAASASTHASQAQQADSDAEDDPFDVDASDQRREEAGALAADSPNDSRAASEHEEEQQEDENDGDDAAAPASGARGDDDAAFDSDPFADEDAEAEEVDGGPHIDLGATALGGTLAGIAAFPVYSVPASSKGRGHGRDVTAPTEATSAAAAVAASPSPARPAAAPPACVTDSSDDEGLHALLAPSNSSKSLFSSLLQKNAPASVVAPQVRRPPITAAELLSPPLSPSATQQLSTTAVFTPTTASPSPFAPAVTPAAPVTASLSNAAAADDDDFDLDASDDDGDGNPPPPINSQSDALDASAQIREHEATLAALRAREQELMARKWAQVQAEEQAAALADEQSMGSDGEAESIFGEDALPRAGGAPPNDSPPASVPSSAAPSVAASASSSARSSRASSTKRPTPSSSRKPQPPPSAKPASSTPARSRPVKPAPAPPSGHAASDDDDDDPFA